MRRCKCDVVDARTNEVLAHKGEYSNLASTTYAKEHPEKYYVTRWYIREIGLDDGRLVPLIGEEVTVLNRGSVITGVLEQKEDLWRIDIEGARVTFAASEVWDMVLVCGTWQIWLKRPVEPDCFDGVRVRTPEGWGDVVRSSPPMRRVWVQLEEGVKEFSSLQLMVGGGGSLLC
jgi:hypothetical protein